MSAAVHGAAAVIAAGLSQSAAPHTTAQCEALATAEGYARFDARAGLLWAIERGLVRRSYGPRHALLHQLVNSPRPAGRAAHHSNGAACAES